MVRFRDRRTLSRVRGLQADLLLVTPSGVLIPGAGEQTEVGSIKDYRIQRQTSEGPDVAVRTFTPKSRPPASGYPILMWLHGGGFVLGSIDTENVVCSRFCEMSQCVVITVDYR